MANKMCIVLSVVLAVLAKQAVAKPGYAAGYAVDYYVSAIFFLFRWKYDRDVINF